MKQHLDVGFFEQMVACLAPDGGSWVSVKSLP